jgi:SAM-dependent methyltransferase
MGPAGYVVPIDMARMRRAPGAGLRILNLYQELEGGPASLGLQRLVRLVADGKLTPHLGVEADWHDVGKIAQGLVDRRFAGKAVLRRLRRDLRRIGRRRLSDHTAKLHRYRWTNIDTILRMNGFQLYLLGRRLMKIGEAAIPKVAGFHSLPPTVRSVVLDVMEHPNTSISEITTRTGFSQSQVSWAVTKLRDGGALETDVDPADRRRTLVRLAPRPDEQEGAAAIDQALAEAMGTPNLERVRGVVAVLDDLASSLAPRTGFAVPGQGFEGAYTGTPPWDIGRPQPALLELAEAGIIQGRVLDVGCGSGEHVLMAAERGLDATGVDAAPTPIAMAERKAAERGLEARFLVWDALDLGGLGERFDCVLDSGLFHIFDDDDRARYVASLEAVTAPGARFLMLCFSDRQPGSVGPRRVSADEIRSSLASGWIVDAIETAQFAMVGGGPGAEAWRVMATRA